MQCLIFVCVHIHCTYLFSQRTKAECPLEVQGPRVQWYRPATLDQLLELRHRFPHHSDRDKPQYRIVAGNSEIGGLIYTCAYACVCILCACIYVYMYMYIQLLYSVCAYLSLSLLMRAEYYIPWLVVITVIEIQYHSLLLCAKKRSAVFTHIDVIKRVF